MRVSTLNFRWVSRAVVPTDISEMEDGKRFRWTKLILEVRAFQRFQGHYRFFKLNCIIHGNNIIIMSYYNIVFSIN